MRRFGQSAPASTLDQREPIRVFVVDDHDVVRRGLLTFLDDGSDRRELRKGDPFFELNLSSRTQAALLAVRVGLVELRPLRVTG